MLSSYARSAPFSGRADSTHGRPLHLRIQAAIRYHGRFGYECFFYLFTAPLMLLFTGLLFWWMFGEEFAPRP